MRGKANSPLDSRANPPLRELRLDGISAHNLQFTITLMHFTGKLYESLTPELQDWLAYQKVFFVATISIGDGWPRQLLAKRRRYVSRVGRA